MNTAGAEPLATRRPRVGRERLVTTFIFAVLAHGIVLLGVGFVALAPLRSPGSSVDITLVNSEKTAPPRHATYLARVDQRGPGNTRRRTFARPASASPEPFRNPGFALANTFAAAVPSPAVAQALTSSPDRSHGPDIVTTRARNDMIARAVTGSGKTARPSLLVRLAEPTPRLGATRAPAVELPRLYGPEAKAGARSVNALAALAAPYLLAWQQRVERIGTAQFANLVPGEVHGGHLTLAVTLGADGSVRAVAIIKRSHRPLLDAAALKIIRLAAPFPPFPAALAARTKTLTFSYRWHFIRGAAGAGVLGLGGH